MCKRVLTTWRSLCTLLLSSKMVTINYVHNMHKAATFYANCHEHGSKIIELLHHAIVAFHVHVSLTIFLLINAP